MKILVLYHSSWMEMMLKSWQRSGMAEVASLPLPVVDWNEKPELKDKISRMIVDYAMVWRPDMILDVNGTGVLPVSGQSRWTPELALAPWVEWWFDDPLIYASSHRAAGTLEPWLKALGCPLVKNFIWDATLAKEYSVWTGKRWTHLPTATDPELFSPASAEASASKFDPVDFCFLGTCYKEPEEDASAISQEINHMVSMRIMRPMKSYFDLFEDEPETFACIKEAFAKARRHLWGSVSPEVCDIKGKCNEKTGYFLRSNVLKGLAEIFPSRLLAGDGYPPSMRPAKSKFFTPSILSAGYQAATLSVDLANSQSFSGTNLRVYEIMASGGVLACNRRPDFDREGKLDGKAYFSFEKPEELKDLCERMKTDKSLRASVSAEARAVARRDHSWVNRLQAIMETPPS